MEKGVERGDKRGRQGVLRGGRQGEEKGGR